MNSDTKEIKLYRRTKYRCIDEVIPNLVALVDTDRYELINKYKWGVYYTSTTAYPRTTIDRIEVMMHWMVIGKPLFGYMVDHVDRNGCNAKFINLRIVTNRQNTSSRAVKYSSIYPGVSWNKEKSIWQVFIRIEDKNAFLGYFTNEFEAFATYRQALLLCKESLLSEYENHYVNEMCTNKNIIESVEQNKYKIISIIENRKETRNKNLVATQEAVKQWGIKYASKGVSNVL